jgi:hypothetical protein
MPPERSRKLKERVDLANRIERGGFEMSPCSFCQRTGRRCVVSSPDASRCAECVRQGRGSCNFQDDSPSTNEWISLDRQRERLRSEEEEAMAKILRLRKQQRFLDNREKEMLRRGLRSLDELDAAEEEERLEKERKEKEKMERREQEAQAATSAASAGASSDPLAGYSGVVFDGDFSSLPESFWNELGVGGTASQDGRS